MATVKAYFLSDIHLTSLEEPKTHWLLDFFRGIKSKSDVTHLFLLGDIFDLWIAGHKYFRDRFAPIVAELERLGTIGIELHYFEGNHDLYLQHFFGDVCGFQIHRSPKYFDLGGLRVRCEHGDQMDPSDRGYRFLRWLLRTPALEWLAPRLPGDFVAWLGERMSAASRHYTSEIKTTSDERTVEMIHKHAQLAWAAGPYDLIISGHVHVFDDFTFVPEAAAAKGNVPARSINLGSWFDGARALRIEVGKDESRVEWVKLG